MGVKHTVLNAKHHQAEAEIVANAGQRGAVTISTNMAGRERILSLARVLKSWGDFIFWAPHATNPGE